MNWQYDMDLMSLDGYAAQFQIPSTKHDGARLETLHLPRETWNEMGKPAQITVTVERR